MAIALNGTNQYIELPQSVLAGATTFTLEIECSTTDKRGSGSNYRWPTLIGKNISGTVYDDFGLCVNNGYLSFWCADSHNIITSVSIADDSFHRIAVVSDGGAVDLYCDGVKLASTTNAKIGENQTIRIGTTTPDYTSYTPMLLRQARFWSVALNEADLFAELTGSESGLEAWYKFQAKDLDYDNQTLVDYSAKGNTATTHNFTAPATGLMTESFDTLRTVQNAAYAFRYENAGYREKTYLSGVTIEDDSGAKTKTGVAFYQTQYNNNNPYPLVIFPSLSEVWIKFDVYRNNANWRLYFQKSGSHSGFYDDGTLHFVINGSRVCNSPSNTNGLHTILLHLVTGTSDGIAEYWYDGEKIYTHTGNVNGGNLFSQICLQADNANVLFSNIICSDSEIGMDENAAPESFWIQPTITSNGTFGESELATKSGGGADGNAYAIFNDRIDDWINRTNSGAYIDIFAKNPLAVQAVYLYSHEKWLPASGELYFSDDCETWTKCGEWQDPDCTGSASIECTETKRHNYWRLYCLDRAAGKSGNAGISNVNILAQGSTFIVRQFFDTCRKVGNTIKESFDTSRCIGNTVEESFDTCRDLSTKVQKSFDTCRDLHWQIKESFDTLRRIGNTVKESFDTCRNVLAVVHLSFDTCRKINNTVRVSFDTCRKIPYKFIYKPTEPTPAPYTPPTPPAPGELPTPTPLPAKDPNNRLISAQISIKEQSICDDITLTVANCTLVPYSPLAGGLLDYDFSDYIVKSTSHQNITMTVSSMIDWNKYISTAMRYPNFDEEGEVKEATEDDQPKLEWHRLGGIQSCTIVGGKKAFQYLKMPTTTASNHLKYISESLGLKGYLFLFDDFIPSNGAANETITYLSLISNFFSWTKDFPWREVNVFIRDNFLYAIQRGKEPNVIDITGIRHSRPQVNREVVSVNKVFWEFLGARIVKDYYKAYDPEEDVEEDEKGNLTKYPLKSNIVGVVSPYGSSSSSGGVNKGGSVHVVYNNDSQVISHQVISAQKTHKTDYEYTKLTPRHGQVHEVQTDIDEDGNKETTEMWHTTLGNGKTITHQEKDGEFSSTVSSDRADGKSGYRVVGVWSVGGERVFKYRYLLQDSFGNFVDLELDSSQDTNIVPAFSENATYDRDKGYTDPWQKQLFEEICAHNAKIQETISVDLLCPVKNGVPDYQHIIDFRDRLILDGAEYFLVSNTAKMTPREFRQSLQMVRWY